MSNVKRLQVLIPSKEYQRFQDIAKKAGVSLGEWVRQLMRGGAAKRPEKSIQEKLAAIERATKLNLPGAACDIDEMLEQMNKYPNK